MRGLRIFGLINSEPDIPAFFVPNTVLAGGVTVQLQ